MQQAQRRLAGLGWLIFPLLLSIFTMTYQGDFQADDEHIFAARAQSLALHGDLEATQVYGNARVRQLDLWGDQATEVEPALSVIGAGFYWLALQVGWGGVQLMFTANLYLVAGTAYLIYRTCRLFSMKDRYALLTAIGFGLTSFAMPYALSFYRDPLAMFMTAMVFYGLAVLLATDNGGNFLGFIWIGLGLVLGALAKNTVLAVIPALIVGWLFLILHEGRQAFARASVIILGGLLSLVGLSLLLPSTGILARFSAEYYLSLIEHFFNNFSSDTLLALAGPWFSPGKSIFLFAPMLLLAIFPAPYEGNRRIFQTAAFSHAFILALAQALFYGAEWHGGYGWGLRFMLPALPALAVTAGFVLERWWTDRGWRRLTAAFLLFSGFIMQQSASWIPWRWSYQRMQEAGINPLSHASAWSLKAFAPAWQLTGLFSWRAYDTAWLRLWWQGKPGALLAPLASLILLLAVALLFVIDRSSKDNRRLLGVKLILLLAALSAPILGVGMLKGDPELADDHSQFHTAISELTVELGEDEAVVMDAYGTSLWYFMMNRWQSATPWYSLPYEVPSVANAAHADLEPAGSSIALFNQLLVENGTLHYLTTTDAPDFSLNREIRWLESNTRQFTVRQFNGRPELYIYSFQAK